MTRNCFFVEHPVDHGQDHVILTGRTAHHISSVLRLQSGQLVELRDGCGRGWFGIIGEIERGSVRVWLETEQEALRESSLVLTLVLAYSRGDRMDLVLRQATELGVHRFLTFRARRSQYRLSESQKDKRTHRWLRIARETVCQCRRTRVPEIMILSDVAECVEVFTNSKGNQNDILQILAYEEEEQGNILELHDRFPRCREVVVVIGPEGGWAPDEKEIFERSGFWTIRLGPRIMRLETAAVALLSSVQVLWGDLSH